MSSIIGCVAVLRIEATQLLELIGCVLMMTLIFSLKVLGVSIGLLIMALIEIGWALRVLLGFGLLYAFIGSVVGLLILASWLLGLAIRSGMFRGALLCLLRMGLSSLLVVGVVDLSPTFLHASLKEFYMSINMLVDIGIAIDIPPKVRGRRVACLPWGEWSQNETSLVASYI